MIGVVGVIVNVEIREKIILKYKKFNIKKEMKIIKTVLEKIKEEVKKKIKDKIKEMN